MKRVLKQIARYLGYEVSQSPPPASHVVFSDTTELDYEVLKAFATRVAESSASPQGTQAIRNFHLTGLLREQPYAESIRVEIGNGDTRDLGVWRRTRPGAHDPFVRRMDSRADWFYWADKERIEPKRCKRRVVLLGESVARGYLYDPAFTPASVLEGMLKSYLGEDEVDVVDLAKSNLSLQQLKGLAGQCLALSPDMVVIFAGNNWRMHITEPDIPHVDSLLRRGGVPAMQSFLDARRQQAVRQFTEQVNGLLNARGVPVIWVVPEFNLVDWADPVSNVPHLTGQGNKEWRVWCEQAEAAMRVRDLGRAEQCAEQMVNLDGGSNAIPLRILVECRRAKGDLQGARRYLEMCRDADGRDPAFSYSPRVASSIQIALRAAASGPNAAVIDLPEIFRQHLNDALPDRRIFLDYCHLTAEGITVAMAAVSSKALKLLTGQSIPRQDIQGRVAPPSAKVEGKASFLAAVHNAHFYQGPAIVQYWCARALQLWPECARIMRSLVDFQTRRTPIMACKSAINLFENDELDTLRYLLHRGGKQRLDLVLSEAIVKSVHAAGLDIGKEVADLRAAEHSITNGPKELTDFYYSSTMLGPSERCWTTKSFAQNRALHCIYALAFWDTSRFVFFGEKGRPIGLRVTYRVPSVSKSGGIIDIAVNGHRVAEAPVERTWQTLEVSVLGNCAANGLNEIVLAWPDGDHCPEAALNEAADAVAARRLPHFYRVFGEIHSLVVFDASGAGEFTGTATAVPS